MPTLLKIEDRKTGFVYHFPNQSTTYFMDNFTNNTISLITLPGVDSGFDPYVAERGATAKGSIQARFMLKAPDGGSYDERRRVLNNDLIALGRVADFGTMRLWVQFDGSPASYYNDCKLQNITLPQSAKSYDDLFIEPGLFFTTERPVWINPSARYTRPTYGGGYTYGSGVKYGSDAPSYAAAGLQTDLSIDYDGNATTPCRIVVTCGATSFDPVPTYGGGYQYGYAYYGGSGASLTETITTLKIRRLVNGVIADEIDYPAALANGDVLTIDAINSSITKNSSSAYSTSFDYLHPDWFRLAPGSNDIRVILGATDDSCSVKIEYSEVIRR